MEYRRTFPRKVSPYLRRWIRLNTRGSDDPVINSGSRQSAMIRANIFLPDVDEISTCHWDQCAKLQIDIQSLVSMIPPNPVIFLKDSRETSPSREIYHHSLVPDINLVCCRKRNAEKITSFGDRERASRGGRNVVPI